MSLDFRQLHVGLRIRFGVAFEMMWVHVGLTAFTCVVIFYSQRSVTGRTTNHTAFLSC